MPKNEDIIPTQMEAIEKMKSRFKNDVSAAMYEDPRFFYRFLKARDFNLNQAETMISKHLQWRKSNKIDTFLEDYEPLEVLTKYSPFNLFAVDKEGSQCIYTPLATFDVKGIQKSVKPIDVDNYVLHMLEIGEKNLKERAKTNKECYPGSILIYDLKDLPFAFATNKRGIEDFIRTAKIVQDNYPERLKCIFVINASNFITIPFSIIKRFLAPVVLKKINWYGTEGWKEHLLKIIDADQLPAFLGGNKTDPDGDPSCKSFINFGSPVPECYYLKKSKNSLCDDPLAKKLVIPRASTSEINLSISVPGSLIEWDFETKYKDIAFGLFFKETEENREKVTELIPLRRLDTETSTETGMYKCETPGKYTILFDNSYSWFWAKEIYYKTSVVSPKEKEVQM